MAVFLKHCQYQGIFYHTTQKPNHLSQSLNPNQSLENNSINEQLLNFDVGEYNNMQKPNRPILKKVKQVNYNNPSLNSMAMKGIFFTGGAPPIIRDELRYNDKYRDSLEQKVEEVQTMKHQEKQIQVQYQGQKPATGPQIGTSRLRYHKNQVIEKVNQIPMDGAVEQHYNYDGYRAIKYKQLHGFNIISNF